MKLIKATKENKDGESLYWLEAEKRSEARILIWLMPMIHDKCHGLDTIYSGKYKTGKLFQIYHRISFWMKKI